MWVSSSTLQINKIEDAIYSFPPGEGNTPQYILLDHDFEVFAFPDFFPMVQLDMQEENHEKQIYLCVDTISKGY